MSENTNVETANVTVETPAGKPVKATKTSKKVAKPVAKKVTTKVVKEKKTGAVKKDRSLADVPAKDRRRALVKLLRKLGATSVTTARPIKLLAEKLSYTDYDVYCLAYHKFQLAVAGLVKTVQVEDVRGLSVYLTAKGNKAIDEQIP